MADRMEQEDNSSNIESADRLCDSTDDEEFTVNQADEIQNYSDDNISEDENVPEDSVDEVWTSRGKLKTGSPFTKDYGPNIFNNTASPSEIFWNWSERIQ